MDASRCSHGGYDCSQTSYDGASVFERVVRELQGAHTQFGFEPTQTRKPLMPVPKECHYLLLPGVTMFVFHSASEDEMRVAARVLGLLADERMNQDQGGT